MKFRALSLCALLFGAATSLRYPEGPNQQCADDAGAPWSDDSEIPYYAGFPTRPKLPASGECPQPLAAACASKGALSAHLDGPVDCGGRGWFCRIREQPGYRMPGVPAGTFPDSNYADCKADPSIDTDHDRDGHCHGSDVDDTYGWWVRDHYNRNYAGTLECCCGWGEPMLGVVNRCDYRKHVTPAVRPSCRDANEEHTVDFNPGCESHAFKVPPPETCWEVTSFGYGPHDDPPLPVVAPTPPPPSTTAPPSAPPTPTAPPTSPPSTTTTPPPEETAPPTTLEETPEETAPPTMPEDPNPPSEECDALLCEGFANPSALTRWKVVDLGRTQAPSEWALLDEGGVEQTTNIRSREPHRKLEKLGTELVFAPLGGVQRWPRDYSLGLRLRSDDNDMLGVSLRRLDDKNYLRLSLDGQRRRSRSPTRRLVQVVDGVPTLLASDRVRYRPRGPWLDVEVQVVGETCRVYVDSELVFESDKVENAGAGTVSLYSFANRGAQYSDVTVRALEALPSGPTYALANSANELQSNSNAHQQSPTFFSEEDDAEMELDQGMGPSGGNDQDGGIRSVVIPVGAGVVAALAAVGVAAIVAVRRRRVRRAAESDGLTKAPKKKAPSSDLEAGAGPAGGPANQK